MKTATKYLEEVEIKESSIIQFPSGIPGFLEETQFVLLDLPGNNAFQTLQSVTTADVAFIVTDPYQFYKSYELKLDENILETLEIQSEQDVIVLSIVTLKSPFEMSTLNLKAPLIINSTHKLGKQYILNNDQYLSKASIVLPDASQVEEE